MTPDQIIELAKRNGLIGNVGTEAAILRFVEELIQQTDLFNEGFTVGYVEGMDAGREESILRGQAKP